MALPWSIPRRGYGQLSLIHIYVVQMLVVGAEQEPVGRHVAVQQAVYKHRKVFRSAALANRCV